MRRSLRPHKRESGYNCLSRRAGVGKPQDSATPVRGVSEVCAAGLVLWQSDVRSVVVGCSAGAEHGTDWVLLSLSRLSHWLPRGQAHPEVMQGTAEFHDQIADTLFPQADAVFDDATALHTAIDMLDAQPTLVQRLVRSLLFPREFLAAGFLGWHEDFHLGQRERQEPQILQQPTPGR
jgi:hypothetical protein